MKPAPAPTETGYAFRPRPTRASQDWTVSDTGVTGPPGSLSFGDVRDVALLQWRGTRTRMIRLDLSDGLTTTMVEVARPRSDLAPSYDQRQFLALVSDLSTRLSHVAPDLTYRMEDTGRHRSLRCLSGVLVLLIGLVLTGLAFVNLYRDIPLLLLALPFLAGTKLAGAVLIYRNWPGHRPEQFPIATLPFILWTLGGPRPEGIPQDQSAPMS